MGEGERPIGRWLPRYSLERRASDGAWRARQRDGKRVRSNVDRRGSPRARRDPHTSSGARVADRLDLVGDDAARCNISAHKNARVVC